MNITKQKYFLIWLFGLISGFTLMISGNTLNFWLAKEQIDIKTIGVFTLISIPYAINFIWAPIFDRKKIPLISKFFGDRLSWIIIIEILLSIAVYALSTLNPAKNLLIFSMIGVSVSFLASAQDTILGAVRTEIISKGKQGQVSGIYIFGYRIGMLISGSGSIFLSSIISWNLVYKLITIVIITFPVILIFMKKHFTPIESHNVVDTTLFFSDRRIGLINRSVNFIISILRPVGTAKFIALTLLFLILYRVPDNFIAIMINPFLLHLGYNEFQIAVTGKFFGIIAAIVGGLIASSLMKKRNIFECLFVFGVLHAAAHSLFIIQEEYGKNIYLLSIVIGFESVTGGMSMAAYIALIASLCHGKYRATQYSFFSSMMGLSRSVFPAVSGYIVADYGWKSFYFFTTIATIPSFIVLRYLYKAYAMNLKQK